MPPTRTPNSDTEAVFDADSQLKLTAVHDVIQHPDKFAELFVKAATSQTSVKDHIRGEIKNSLSADPPTRKAVEELVEEYFKKSWKVFIRSTGGKIALGFWSIILIVLGAWLGHIWK